MEWIAGDGGGDGVDSRRWRLLEVLEGYQILLP